MIKKIEFISTDVTTVWRIFKIHFYTKVNGVWANFNPGAYKSGTVNSAVFENMTVTTAKNFPNANILKNIFNGTGDAGTNYSSSLQVGDPMTITFTKGLKVLSGIYYAAHSAWCNAVKFKIYDENNRLIYSDDKPVLKSSTALQFYKTTGLELMKVYPVNTVGTIETNDNTQIKEVYQIEGITVSQNTPEGTDVKYLISFDGRKTYKTYKDGIWSNIDINNLSNIIEFGLTKSEIEAIKSQQFNEAISENRTVDVIAGMITNTDYNTPSISEIKVLYLKIV